MKDANPKQSHTPKDYTQPTRMSWEALVIGIIRNFWKLLKVFFPVLLVTIFSPTKSILALLGFWGLLLVWVLIVEIYRYFHTTFYIEGDKLRYHSNLLIRTTDRTIPLDRVHAYRTKSSFVYQMVDMVGIVFETLADEKEEVELVLSEEDLRAFMEEVNRHSSTEVTEDADCTNCTDATPQVKQTIKYSPIQLIQGALVQNHLKGLAIIGYIIWAIYSEISDVLADHLGEIADYTSQQFEVMAWTTIIAILVIAYLVSALLFITFILARFFGLTIELTEDEISYTAGLFNRVTNKFSRDKVFGYTLRQNILERWTHRTSIRLEQAANVQGKKQKHEIILIGTKDYTPLTDWWLGAGAHDDRPLYYAHSGPAIGWIRFMIGWAWIYIPLLVLSFFYPLYTLPFLLIVTGIGIWDAHTYRKRSDITACEDGIIIRGGGLSHHSTHLMYEGIEQVRLTRSPFAYRSHRTGLVISTNGGKFRVRSLSESDAYTLFNYLLYRIER